MLKEILHASFDKKTVSNLNLKNKKLPNLLQLTDLLKLEATDIKGVPRSENKKQKICDCLRYLDISRNSLTNID